MLKLLKIVARAGEATEKYPFAPMPVSPGFRGKPECDSTQCIACGACVLACPPNALSVHTDADAGQRTWALNLGRCIFCGRCEEVCPTHAIALTEDFELAVGSKADLLQQASFALAHCRECGKPFAPRKALEHAAALLAATAGKPEAQPVWREQLECCPACRREQALQNLDLPPTLTREDA